MTIISSAAKRRIQDIDRYVRFSFENNDSLRAHCLETTAVYHCFISGLHVDPDAGREYVPLSNVLTKDCKRLIKERNKKVNRIFRYIRDSLVEGVPAKHISLQLAEMQNFLAVGFASDPDEAATILTEMFREDYLCAGSVEDDEAIPVAGPGVLFIWREALSCSGGITDRYTLAQLKRQNRE
jgi:hypothetical protein